MARNLLILVAVVGTIAAIANRPSDHRSSFASMTDRSRSESSSKSSESGSATEVANGDGIELDRNSDGHFYADVDINGTPVHMLVDTGATGVALSRDDARKAGIATSIGMPNVVGQGADGDVHGEVAQIDHMQLGSTSAEKVEAIILNNGEMSLLGQDFLQRFASVEIKDDKMVLR